MLTPHERKLIALMSLKQLRETAPQPEPWMWNPAIPAAIFDYLFLKQLHICAD